MKRPLVFIRGIVLLSALLIIIRLFLLDIENTASLKNQSLSDLQIINTIKKMKKTPLEIDIVVLSPFVEENSINFSILSVLRFAPWIKTIHLQTSPINADHKEMFKSWTIPSSKLIKFSVELNVYALTTPALSEHFIILKPGFCLSNYIFPHQFFTADQKLSLRYVDTGIVPMTRQILNSGSFYEEGKSLGFVLKKLNKTQKCINNRDHLSIKGEFPSTTKIDKKLTDEFISKYWAFRKPVRITKTPIDIVVCFIGGDESSNESIYQIDSDFEHDVIVYFRITTGLESSERLSFIGRMMAMEVDFFEIPVSSNVEKSATFASVEFKKKFPNNFKIKAVYHLENPKTTRQKYSIKLAFVFSLIYNCANLKNFDNQQRNPIEHLRLLAL
jgi:hypothetical protein